MSTLSRISVIVPTYQRRARVVQLARALQHQTYDGPFELIVVVDGSTDGTTDALGALTVEFPLRVCPQPNQGPARARNRGSAHATGEILLFLDDDMEPAPTLLAEHARSHATGADAVTGVIPLHPDSPPTLLARGVREWADAFARRQADPAYVPRFDEILSGHLSVRRSVFEQLGGFDERFTADGSYGDEDLDFGHRLLEGGYRVVHNPRAVSRQYYDVDAATHFRHYFQAGKADVALVRKHPKLAESVFVGKRAASRLHRWLWRPVLLAPGLAALAIAPLRKLVIARIARGASDRPTTSAFFAVRTVDYWRGVQHAGGVPGNHSLRVLCYHAVADLAGVPTLGHYGVPPAEFRAQLDLLQRAGYHFISPGDALRFVERRAGLPRRALLLTFDDCYDDLLTHALPLLEERGIPAIAFAVSGYLGRGNEWEEHRDARTLRLLSPAQLRALARRGVEIGAHSHTHRSLVGLSDVELCTEIADSVTRLRQLGVGPVRFFAYPYGEHDARACWATERAGVRAAFTVNPGLVRAGDDAFRLRRVEILRGDMGLALRMKVAVGGYRLDLIPRLRGWIRLRTRLRRWHLLPGAGRATQPLRDSGERAREIPTESEVEPRIHGPEQHSSGSGRERDAHAQPDDPR